MFKMQKNHISIVFLYSFNTKAHVFMSFSLGTKIVFCSNYCTLLVTGGFLISCSLLIFKALAELHGFTVSY